MPGRIRHFRYCLLGLALACGHAAAGTSAPELAGRVTLAPYATLSAQTLQFGTLIGNPIVPALLLSALQQQAVTAYGAFRTDAPVHFFSYAAGTNATVEAVVYPSVDRIARMALAHPGSERRGPDELYLPPEETRAARVAVFAADGVRTVFADDAVTARAALAACPPPAGDAWPLVSADLRARSLAIVRAAAARAGATNLAVVVHGFTQLALTADLTPQGFTLAFRGRVSPDVPGGAAARARRLADEWRAVFAGLSAGAQPVVPQVRAAAAGAAEVVGELTLSRAQLTALGQDFNALVAARMSGARADGKKEKKAGAD